MLKVPIDLRLVPLSVWVLPFLLGAATAALISRTGSSALWFVAASSLALVLAATGPRLLLAMVAGLSVTGFVPTLVSLGSIQLRLDDLIFVPLVLWIVSLNKGRSWGDLPVDVRRGLGRGVVFVGYIALSVWAVAIVEPEHFPVSLVSFLRLVQTLSLVWIAFHVVEQARDATFLIRAVMLAAALAVGMAGSEALGGGGILTSRFGGLLNENALGLVSGLLVLSGLFSAALSKGRLSILSLGIGATGLFLSKSIGGIVATAAVALAGFVWSQRRDDRRIGAGATIGLCTLLVLAIFGSVSLLRPQSLPTSEEFRSSSAYHRLIVGAAGLETFARHPLVGVGWQRTLSESVIRDEDTALAIRETYPDVTSYLYPEVEPTNFHNAFVQLLAELGIVGFLLFWYAVGGLAVAIKRSIGRLPQTRSDPVFLTLSLLFILIWWNDNAIFGGQTESVIGAIFLGSLLGLMHPVGASPPQVTAT